jgi:hypothetical protein
LPISPAVEVIKADMLKMESSLGNKKMKFKARSVYIIKKMEKLNALLIKDDLPAVEEFKKEEKLP